MIGPATSQNAPVRTDRNSGITLIEQTMPLAGLPAELSGLTLVQLSDLHRGGGVPDSLLKEAVALANGLSPDLIVLTGDMVDEHKTDILPAVKILSALSARLGVYAVLGNHDQRGDPELLTSALETAGIPVLSNTAVEPAPGLWLAGVDDMIEGEPDFGAALRALPPGAATIFLCHNPEGLKRVPAERPLVMLSGHTHGAQFRLPFPTPTMICQIHLRTRYVHGWFQRGAARLYVNRGIGVTGAWPTNRRINCPPEVTRFRLQSAPK